MLLRAYSGYKDTYYRFVRYANTDIVGEECGHIYGRPYVDKLFNKKIREKKPDGGVHRHILHLLALTEEPKLSADEKKKKLP